MKKDMTNARMAIKNNGADGRLDSEENSDTEGSFVHFTPPVVNTPIRAFQFECRK